MLRPFATLRCTPSRFLFFKYRRSQAVPDLPLNHPEIIRADNFSVGFKSGPFIVEFGAFFSRSLFRFRKEFFKICSALNKQCHSSLINDRKSHITIILDLLDILHLTVTDQDAPSSTERMSKYSGYLKLSPATGTASPT